MTARKKSYTWIISPAITIIVLFAGFQYTRGQQSQVLHETTEKAKECKIEINSIKEEQSKVNKEVLIVLNQIKVDLAEVKTEMKYISGRGKIQ